MNKKLYTGGETMIAYISVPHQRRATLTRSDATKFIRKAENYIATHDDGIAILAEHTDVDVAAYESGKHELTMDEARAVLGHDLHAIIIIEDRDDARDLAENYGGHQWAKVRALAAEYYRAIDVSLRNATLIEHEIKLSDDDTKLLINDIDIDNPDEEEGDYDGGGVMTDYQTWFIRGNDIPIEIKIKYNLNSDSLIKLTRMDSFDGNTQKTEIYWVGEAYKKEDKK